ncbi:MCM DNA helicase complex subunit mcm6, partial [Coemansia aciculifera]
MMPTSSGAVPPLTSSIPMLESESSLRHRLGSDAVVAEDVEVGGDNMSRSKSTTEEVQEERARRLRATLGQTAREGRGKVRDEAAEAFRVIFETFLETFQEGADRIYVEQARRVRSDEGGVLRVDFGHLMQYDERAAAALLENYLRLDAYLSQAAQRVVQRATGGSDPAVITVSVFGLPSVNRVRELRADKIGALACVGGTVTRTTEVRPELIAGVFRCQECGTATSPVAQQFRFTEPAVCENSLCQNRVAWTLEVGRSEFADWQRVRVQENAAEIPAGSMPRTLDVIVRGDAVERVKPGDRALFTGALVALPEAVSTAIGGGGKIGASEASYRLAFLACHAAAEGTAANEGGGEDGEDRDAFLASLTREEREELAAMAAGGASAYAALVASVAPTVFGHDELKRGVLLQMLGGVHKRTAEGMRLRGDINVCIVGDPSTSKSQLLKYVAGFLPRAVFTSGKAS